jgi:hypothetical protein
MWYDKAIAWMDENARQNEEAHRFRAEAVELLGIIEPQLPATPKPLENKDQNKNNPTPASRPKTEN